jgi:hypothetical protein
VHSSLRTFDEDEARRARLAPTSPTRLTP